MPLYEALMKTPAGAAVAKRVFAKARPGYHPETVAAIEAIVAPKEETASESISEWMKVMLEEIARKKAEASKRASRSAALEEQQRRESERNRTSGAPQMTGTRARDRSVVLQFAQFTDD